MKYPDLFKDYPNRKGKNWLQSLPAEVRRIFSELGRSEFLHGHMGGKARAATAKRDKRGRFTKN